MDIDREWLESRLHKLDTIAEDVAVLKDRSNRGVQLSAVVAAAVGGAVSAVISFVFRGSHA
jgi:hypothetical protein